MTANDGTAQGEAGILTVQLRALDDTEPPSAADACARVVHVLEAISGHGDPGAGSGSDDPLSAVYTIGVALYRALTGRLPSPGGANGPFPPPVQPPELDLVLRRALAPDRRVRYQSPADFAVELRAVGARVFGAQWTAEQRGGAALGDCSSGPVGRCAASEGVWWASSAAAPPTPTRALASAAVAVAVAVAALAGWQTGWPTTIFGAKPTRAVHSASVLHTVSNWSAVAAPGAALPSPPTDEPTGAGSPAGAAVLSCPTTSFCVAVSGSAGSLETPQNDVETFASGAWTLTELPTASLSPPPATPPGLALNAVSCPEAGWCVAVGSYHDDTGATRGVIETFSNGSWGARAAPGAGRSGALDDVTCSAVGSCVAIGQADSAAGIWELSSGKWTETSAPTDGLEPSSGTTYPPQLARVSCPSTVRCVAVGTYYTADGTELGLTETLRSGNWSASAVPVAPGLTDASGSALQAVSCPTPAFCAAFGSVFDAAGYLHGLVDTFSDGRWTSSEVSVGNSGPSSSSREWMYLTSLDCPSAGFCLATGWYFASSSLDEVRSFDLALSGASWKAQAVHMNHLDPGVGSLDALPLAASCQAADHCVVVGSYDDASGNEHGLIETLGGEGGKRPALPPPVCIPSPAPTPVWDSTPCRVPLAPPASPSGPTRMSPAWSTA